MATAATGDDVGSVYVLTNTSLSGMVKVGFTKRTAQIRARELSGTSLPTPFEVFYETDKIRNPRKVERAVHNDLVGSRIQNGREFFKVTPEEARTAIEAAVLEAEVDELPGSNDTGNSSAMVITVPPGVTQLTLQFGALAVGAAAPPSSS